MRTRVKSPHARKARRGGESEKWGTTDKAQVFYLSRPTDFGVWSSYRLSNQLSASNGVPCLIELLLPLSSVNCRGYLSQMKENPDTNFLRGCFSWRILECKKGFVREHTTFTSCQNAAGSNDFFFLWRIDYALEENILIERVWVLPPITC